MPSTLNERITYRSAARGAVQSDFYVERMMSPWSSSAAATHPQSQWRNVFFGLEGLHVPAR